MKTMWAVSHGEYSDYGVDFVCADRELADRMVAKLTRGREYYGVEEIAMVEDDSDVVPRVYYGVTVDHMGNETSRWSYVSDIFGGGALDDPGATAWRNSVNGWSYKSFDVALKAARDKLAEVKAAEAGL